MFILLATANGATYRYGGSDQAFYIPAVIKALDPASFPRDGSLIDAQGALILADEAVAAAMRVTGASIETVFLAGYLLSLALVWAGIVLIGSRVYDSPWLTLALGAAFTLRHRIPQTSANSFEPYFHPRMVAFGIGLLAIAAFLRQRYWATIALVAVAAAAHATTALWFAVLLGVAIAVASRSFRPVIIGSGTVIALFLAWAALAGPLRESLVVMDDVWLQAVASKDSLFADQWPAWVWAANLGMLALLWWVHRGPLAWGATALVAFFLLTFPFVLARVHLIVEFQISRVFWVIDFLATVYLLAKLAAWRPQAARVLGALLLAVSVGRGLFVLYVENPERPLFATHLAETPWHDAMRWVGAQPSGIHVLADPGHAWKHGTSVRVSAGRDVFLEEVKDSALAIYSRDVAHRVVERTQAIGDFTQLTPERARELATQYDLDYLVTTADLPLPIAYQNREFRVYSLAP
jgi:hypothetical protein